MLCDNQAALAVIKNPVSSARAKHIDRMHHFVRERAARGEIKFDYVPSGDNVADIMTKLLPAAGFDKCKEIMGMH